jgi:hypothetical protein
MRVAKLMALAAIVFAGAPAIAAPILWGKVEIDMPFAQARAAYPDGHVNSGKGLYRPMITFKQEIDGCDVEVLIGIDRKVAEPGAKVENVMLIGQRCDAKMFAQLLARYGEPLTLNNDNDDKKKTARWISDGRAITYKRWEGSGFQPDSWTITYEGVKDLGL